MADVTTTFAAEDESFARTVEKLSDRLEGFEKETQQAAESIADKSGAVQDLTGKLDGLGANTEASTQKVGKMSKGVEDATSATKDLQQESENVASRIGTMAKGFAAAAIPIAGMIAAFVGVRSAAAAFRDAIEMGSRLNDLAAQTGETAGELAVLQRAFANAGMSGGEVGTMLNRLQRFMVEASEGGSKQSEAMEKLGLSYDELKEKSPSEQMQELAKRIAAIDDPAQRSALAMDIFGRGGGQLMPLLRAMGVELDNARSQLGSYPDAIDRANKALDTISDNFGAVAAKAREFVTGALVDIAPTIARASDALAQMDFAAMGMKLSAALQRVYDFFVGLFQNPSQIFGLYGDYLNAVARTAGDSLISAFLTAGNALSTFLQELVSRGAFSQFGNVLANGFVYAVSQLNLALINTFDAALRFLGQLWNDVTGQGTGDLSKKLFDVVKFFASDFGQAMINPLGFIAGKVSSALIGATKEAAEEYKFAFNDSTESYIGKARAGWEAVSTGAAQRLQDSATEFRSTLESGAKATAEQAKVVEVHLFGGAEAMERLTERVSQIADAGSSLRGDIEASVEPAEQIGSALGTISVGSISLKDALSESFPLAAALKEEAKAMAEEGQLFASNVQAAEANARVVADIISGPTSLTQAVSQVVSAANATVERYNLAAVEGQKFAGMLELERQMDRSHREFERSQDRANNLRERGQHSAAMNAELRAREKLLHDTQKNHAEALANEKREKALMLAEEKKSLDERIKARRDAENEYKKDMKEISDTGGRNFGDGAEAIKEGGDESGLAMQEGGTAAGEAMETAAAAFKDVVDDSKDISKDIYNWLKDTFFAEFKERLPQNALS
jgi:hypothetical protein